MNTTPPAVLARHGMARKLDRMAETIAERAPAGVASTMKDAAECIQVLYEVKHALAAEVATLRASLAQQGEADSDADGISPVDWRRVVDAQMTWNGIPVRVTGSVGTHFSNWKLIPAALQPAVPPEGENNVRD